jgi:hypothetical protein
MIRKYMFGLAASLMTLSAFSGTIAVLNGGGAETSIA